MKKISILLALTAFVLVLSGGALARWSSDITGTWVGETTVADAFEPDKLTLVIEKKDDSYVGTLSDTHGFASEAQCENLTFEDNQLKFTFDISDGYSVETIYITLKVEGDTMTGVWENDAGDGAEITMQRKK